MGPSMKLCSRAPLSAERNAPQILAYGRIGGRTDLSYTLEQAVAVKGRVRSALTEEALAATAAAMTVAI